MSDENTQGTTAGTTRTMVSANGKPLTQGERPELKFINFKKLNDAGTTGVVAEGIYEGSRVVEGGPYGPKTEYSIRAEDGTLQIVSEAGSLKRQMSKIKTGKFVQVSYFGKETMEDGPRKGQLSHKVIVGLDASEYEAAE